MTAITSLPPSRSNSLASPTASVPFADRSSEPVPAAKPPASSASKAEADVNAPGDSQFSDRKLTYKLQSILFMGQEVTSQGGALRDAAQNMPKTWELSEPEYQSFLASMEKSVEALKQQYAVQTESSCDPRGYQDYANVVVAGKVVATVNNQGGLITYEDGTSSFEIPDFPEKDGPALAQARADYVANKLGGKVFKAATALSQYVFDRIPASDHPPARVDYEAMQDDPWFFQIDQLREVKAKRAEFLSQQTGENSAG